MNRGIRRGAAAILVAGFCACGQTPSEPGGNAIAENRHGEEIALRFGDRAEAQVIDASGVRIGRVVVRQGMTGLLIQVHAEGITPGMHGLHLHASGSCADIGVFKASGGHIVGTGGLHGHLHPRAGHAGDLPNLYVHGDGVARADFFATRIGLRDLEDDDGAALIIHAKPDDYQAQPIGGAGDRIACAAFEPRTQARQASKTTVAVGDNAI